MIIETDKEGNIIYQPEGFRTSSEMKMNLEVYRVRPYVKAVVEVVKKVAQTLYIPKQLGAPSPIPAEEVTALRQFGDHLVVLF